MSSLTHTSTSSSDPGFEMYEIQTRLSHNLGLGSSYLSVSSFFFITGFLIGYSILRKDSRIQKKNLVTYCARQYARRYLRYQSFSANEELCFRYESRLRSRIGAATHEILIGQAHRTTSGCTDVLLDVGSRHLRRRGQQSRFLSERIRLLCIFLAESAPTLHEFSTMERTREYSVGGPRLTTLVFLVKRH